MFRKLNHAINTAIARAALWSADKLVGLAAWFVGWETLWQWRDEAAEEGP